MIYSKLFVWNSVLQGEKGETGLVVSYARDEKQAWAILKEERPEIWKELGGEDFEKLEEKLKYSSVKISFSRPKMVESCGSFVVRGS